MLRKTLFTLGLIRHKYYRDKLIKEFKLYSKGDIYSSQNIKYFINKMKEPISFYYFSGGTTGKPKTIPLTEKELDKKSKYRGSCYKNIGVNSNSRVAILLPFGPWVAGPSAYSAVKSLGCVVFPIGLLKDEHEIMSLFSIIKNHNIDTIVTTPSFIDYALTIAQKNNLKLNLDKVITSGEFITSNIKNKIKKTLGADTYSTYATSEGFIGYECKESCGYHYNPENVLITEENKSLLITFLDSRVVPIYKYNLGDVGHIEKEKCKCESKLSRVIISGREKNIFGLNGAVNVFPYQIVELIKDNDIPAKDCIITLEDSSQSRDLIIFSFGFSNSVDSSQYLDKIKNNIMNLSLDFSDIYHQDLIIVDIKTHATKYIGNKLNISVVDNRQYEK